MIRIGSLVLRVDDRRLQNWDERPPDADYVILADPEGNRFCVVDVNRHP